jgi:hypothetical protein
MSTEEKFSNFEDFIETMKKLNIKKIAFSEVNERRPEQTQENLLEVIVVRQVDILSYKDSIIYKFSDKGDHLESLYEALISEGFDVKRINKNIT